MNLTQKALCGRDVVVLLLLPQSEAKISSLFYGDQYFADSLDEEDEGWLNEQQAMLRLWVTLFTRQVTLFEDGGGRTSASPIPGLLFTPSPTAGGH
jgi:hypothetical protein